MDKQSQQGLRALPSVDAVAADERVVAACPSAPRRLIVHCARAAQDQVREAIIGGQRSGEDVRADVVERTVELLRSTAVPSYRRAVNATGIILHTGLGRAVLPRRAMQRMAEELGGYSVLQVGLESGKRSKRDQRIEWLLQHLTGAEAATVVNNNAAATALVLNAVGAGRQIIVSRGQLVEIGGSFRLPEVMAFSGARMVEVGTTNKTHARDYENAITEETAAILRVHPSNYKIQGFSSEVPLDELVEIAGRHNLVMIDDVGAGALIDFSRFGFEPEPTLPGSIAAGADIVTSSADKLIGGSQGGIILGRKDLIERARKNPLARIVRAGKLTLAALEATLELFVDEAAALKEVPTLAMMLRPAEAIARTAERMAAQIGKAVGDAAQVTTVAGYSQLGSGSLPTQNLATTLVAIAPRRFSAEALAKGLRLWKTPVFARIQADRVLVDPRTLLDGDESRVVEALTEVLGG
ncbi:MAG TPA: L-seryl-tRNA(Sec) selenium transferase [Phycisphaerales bacterium]|nr:L-seryl-tRNA(Sec) selenium transferase [Phycisphaerales bacterium]